MTKVPAGQVILRHEELEKLEKQLRRGCLIKRLNNVDVLQVSTMWLPLTVRIADHTNLDEKGYRRVWFNKENQKFLGIFIIIKRSKNIEKWWEVVLWPIIFRKRFISLNIKSRKVATLAVEDSRFGDWTGKCTRRCRGAELQWLSDFSGS